MEVVAAEIGTEIQFSDHLTSLIDNLTSKNNDLERIIRNQTDQLKSNSISIQASLVENNTLKSSLAALTTEKTRLEICHAEIKAHSDSLKSALTRLQETSEEKSSIILLLLAFL